MLIVFHTFSHFSQLDQVVELFIVFHVTHVEESKREPSNEPNTHNIHDGKYNRDQTEHENVICLNMPTVSFVPVFSVRVFRNVRVALLYK